MCPSNPSVERSRGTEFWQGKPEESLNFVLLCMQHQTLPGKLQMKFSVLGVANQISDFSMRNEN